MENVPLRRLVAKLKVSKQSQSLSNTHNTDIHEEAEPNSLYWIDEILNKLENNKVGTLATLLSLTIIHVAEIAQVDCYRAKSFIELVCDVASPRTKSIFNMAKVMSDKNNQSISTYGSRTYLSTGIDSLDEILNGGIRSSLVTEIVGKAGIGKTQLCLTVSVMTSSKGIGVIYFDTEGKFSPMRLMEIALNRKVVGGAMSESARDFADRIILFKPQSSMELLNQLDSIQTLIVEKNVGIVVIDSVAALARTEFSGGSSSSLVARQDMLSRLATTLKFMAETFNIPILVTNQVSSTSSSSNSFGSGFDDSFGHHQTAALGNTWAHAVNIRIFFEEDKKKSDIRTMRIEKSPLMDEKSIKVEIQSSGIEMIPNV